MISRELRPEKNDLVVFGRIEDFGGGSAVPVYLWAKVIFVEYDGELILSEMPGGYKSEQFRAFSLSNHLKIIEVILIDNQKLARKFYRRHSGGWDSPEVFVEQFGAALGPKDPRPVLTMIPYAPPVLTRNFGQ